MSSSIDSENSGQEKIVVVSEQKPTLCLFAPPFAYNSFDISTKYLLYVMLKTHCSETCDLNMDESQLNKALEDLDFLTFLPWHKVPRLVFEKVFNVLTLDRLSFLCGHFSTYFGQITHSNRQKMVTGLWNHFVEKSKQ